MKAIVTVLGKDRVGIIASVCTLLSENNINILDISQTILQENFTMVMYTDLSACVSPFSAVADALEKLGAEQGLTIRMQREDIFNAMHQV